MENAVACPETSCWPGVSGSAGFSVHSIKLWPPRDIIWGYFFIKLFVLFPGLLPHCVESVSGVRYSDARTRHVPQGLIVVRALTIPIPGSRIPPRPRGLWRPHLPLCREASVSGFPLPHPPAVLFPPLICFVPEIAHRSEIVRYFCLIDCTQRPAL